MARQQVSFRGARGQRLSAVLDLPDGRVRSWAVFAHCFTCSKDTHASTRISRGLAARGIAVLRYDFTGLGDSDGELAEAGFTGDVDDLVAAADHLREHHEAPSLLVGHSLGGAAVLTAAARVPEVRAVATVNAPADPAHATRLLADVRDELAAEGSACVSIAGRRFTVRQELVDDLAAQRLLETVAGLEAAVLVLHAPLDEEVGVDNARRIFDAARHPRSFVSLDGADHLLSRRADSLYVADVIAAWASRYLPLDDRPQPQRASAAGDGPGEGEVVVVETGEGPFAQEVRAGRHTFAADEPPDVEGGTDTGPAPYDLVLAALGACTSMTLRMYADRKGWPLERVTVRLTQRHRHADDASDCVGGGSDCVREVRRVITVEGDLDDSQREKLRLMADRCPVHRTLEQGIRTVTELAG